MIHIGHIVVKPGFQICKHYPDSNHGPEVFWTILWFKSDAVDWLGPEECNWLIGWKELTIFHIFKQWKFSPYSSLLSTKIRLIHQGMCYQLTYIPESWKICDVDCFKKRSKTMATYSLTFVCKEIQKDVIVEGYMIWTKLLWR